MKTNAIYELAAAYAPPMPQGAEERVASLVTGKLTSKKHFRLPRALRPALVAACVLLVLSGTMTVVNANVDLTGLYAPILGEELAMKMQGIHKSCEVDGIRLEVEAAYNDGYSAILIFTLTDMERKGRLEEETVLDSMSMNPSWLCATYGLGSTWGSYEYNPETQQQRFYYAFTCSKPIKGELFQFRINDMGIRHSEEGSDFNYTSIVQDLEVSFRFSDKVETEVYDIKAVFEGGGFDTVSISPISVRFAGTAESSDRTDYGIRVETAEGSFIEPNSTGGSWFLPDIAITLKFYQSIDLDSIAAVWVDGTRYPLNRQNND